MVLGRNGRIPEVIVDKALDIRQRYAETASDIYLSRSAHN